MNVRLTTMRPADMHLERSAPVILRSTDGDALAGRTAEGVLQPGEDFTRRGCGRCVDCGCESRVEKGK